MSERPIHWWGRLGADASEEPPCDGETHRWVWQPFDRIYLCECGEPGFEVPVA